MDTLMLFLILVALALPPLLPPANAKLTVYAVLLLIGVFIVLGVQIRL